MSDAPNKRLRILFCTSNFAPAPTGGAERQALLQAAELIRRGHSVDVVCPRGPVPSGRYGEITVHRLFQVHRRPLQRVSYLMSLSIFCARRLRGYDIVHVHWAHIYTAVVIFWARLLRRPAYIKVAGGTGELAGRYGELRTRLWALRHADLVQAISDEIEHDLLRIGVRRDRIVRIPNGQARGWADPDTHHDSAVPAGRLTVLYVGRLHPFKGLADLLEAWSHLRDVDAELVLLGETSRTDFEVPIAASHVRVEPWGDPRPHLADADVFVLPSHGEGMSNALLEAMAFGKAIVATEVGAASEMLDSGSCGLLVPPHDPAALSSALRRVLSDSALRARLGNAAHQQSARFRIELVVDAIESAYGRIVSKSA